MLNRSDFYKHYDKLIPFLCKNYHLMLQTAADRVSHSAREICEIGIGTGNFSHAVKKRLPKAKISGIDSNKELFTIAKNKIPGLECIYGNAFTIDLPEVDCFISSLTLHHLRPEEREEQLIRIVRSCREFINVDLALVKGRTKRDTIEAILSFAKERFPETSSLECIAQEMEANDHPSDIEKEQAIFESRGYAFSLFYFQFPFAIYKVTNPSKNPVAGQ